MTDTMIERAARAIYEKRNGAGCKPWGIQPKSHKAPYLDDARAAISAMMEPSERMIEARFNAVGKGGKAEWEAMITAALEEGK
jgi:hypothetical protein